MNPNPFDSILISYFVVSGWSRRRRAGAGWAPSHAGGPVQQTDHQVPAPASRRSGREGVSPMEKVQWSVDTRKP